MIFTNVKIKESHNGPYTINSSASEPKSFKGTLRVPDKRVPLNAKGSSSNERKACHKNDRANS